MTLLTQTDLNPIPEIDYPESDGLPMSDNTKQFRWIVTIKENLEIWFSDDEQVFVAGDLLWYPIEGDNKTALAPDTMVVFGRPKGDRGSYKQWLEDNLAPQVAFEILSPSNTQREMNAKRLAYEQFGVEEYYVYDPDRIILQGWIRQGGGFVAIESMQGWVSPRLQIQFRLSESDLEIYRPDGRKFLTPVELDERAERFRYEAALHQQRAEEQQRRAEEEQQRAEAAEAQARQSTGQMEQMILNLLRSGVSIDQVALASGLPVEQIQALQTGM